MFILGVLLWAVGAFDLVPESPLLSLGFLLCGSLQAVAVAYLVLTSRPSGGREHTLRDSAIFCLTLGAGFAAIGFGISPLTPWLLPALPLVLGGVGLIAWSPQAFHRRHP